MKPIRKIIAMLLLCLMLASAAGAQITAGITLGGLAFHPKKEENNKYYKWKLDKAGHFVGFFGVTFSASWSFNEYLGLKFIQTFTFHDCAGNFAGLTHLGVEVRDRVIGWKNEKHRGSASFGPMYYFRRGWNRMPGYVSDAEFIRESRNHNWEYKFIWYGGQLQYDYWFSDTQALSTNFLPGHPYLYTFSTGTIFRKAESR